MFEKSRKAQDAFSFSLGGLRTITSFVAAPAIANDRINRIRDAQIRRARKARDGNPRGWPEGRREAAQTCA